MRLTPVRLRHLRPADYKRMPWKNGGGMTTEVMAEPGPSGTFDWRLSIAEVAQSGPFSDFSGYDRTIMLIEGAGFALDFDPKDSGGAPSKRIDRPYVPFPFAGEWKADCTLIDGPIRDFKPDGRAGAHRRALGGSAPRREHVSSRGEDTLVHALRGNIAVRGEKLAAGDTLRIDSAAAPVEMTGDDAAIAALIRIEPR